MNQEKEYFAFISYKREDEKWAKWLARELEHYHLPSTLNGKDLPQNLRPIFRDVDELSAGNLPGQIYHALSISKNLIVVCSPRSAQSEWVNKEIEDFINIKGGKTDNIYPFIIEGSPFSKEVGKECFPMALKNLSKSEERLGGNINETGGKNVAVVKIIAGMLGVSHDSLWNRYEREQRKIRKIRIAIVVTTILCVLGVAFWMYWQKQQIQKANWKMMENQSRAISEKASLLVDNGNSYLASLLALEMLSSDSVNRPYTVEAERLLRDSQLKETAIVKSEGYNIKFSPDGIRFIQGSFIWDLKSFCRILSIHSGQSKEIIHQWHPSGKFYISSIGDTIKLHSSYSGKCIMKYLGHKKDVYFVSFSPKGDIMVSGGGDNSIKIWKTNNGECIRTVKYNMANVVYFDFLRSGEQFISVSKDSTITVWDARSFRVQRVIKTEIAPSYGCITFCPNKDVIALTHLYSSDVHFIDVKRGTIECKMETNSSIKSIVFCKDGKSLIVGCHNGIDIYDVSKQVSTNICKTASSIESMSLSPNGRHLIAKTFNDDNLLLLDLKPDSGKYMLPFSDSIHFHGFFCTPDKKHVCATDNKGCLYIWNLFDRSLQKRINLGCLFGFYTHSVQVNPVDNNAVFLSSNYTAKIINLESDNLIVTLEGRIDDSMFLRFCDNGKYVLGNNFRWRGTKIWNSKTGKLKCNYTNSLTTCYTDVLVPKHNLLVSVENDSNICLVNIESNAVEKILKGHSKKIHHITSSINGNYIASISVDSIMCIWDINKGKCLHSMRDIDSDRNLIVFSGDESKIASQCLDNSIIVWDVKTGKIVSKMVGHQRDILRVDGICFDPNGKYLLSSSKDQTIRLWDISSGGCLKVFKAGKDMDSAFFTSDGKRIIYHGEDGWMVDEYLVVALDDLIKMTRKRFSNRKLTHEEKMQFFLD